LKEVQINTPWNRLSLRQIIQTDTRLAEYEFFQFRAPSDPNITSTQRNSSSTARFLNENPVNSLPPLTEGMFGYSLTRPVHNQDYYYGIYDACEKFNCGIEGWHTESGPGVFEAVSLASREAASCSSR